LYPGVFLGKVCDQYIPRSDEMVARGLVLSRIDQAGPEGDPHMRRSPVIVSLPLPHSPNHTFA
jgi:hypothetical protein